ncbi:protein of unknown function [Ekhidna lutea]|uniref:DUF4834 domain-containing protein n=1 Tax=Ekhidna lutea TaxID=447679 RepID=A0A239KKY8_EKHLU|nr:DUF4834 family protein [Ekhidna lutea]SNT18660.1 protein of unknown function [Ekhidna lutea]
MLKIIIILILIGYVFYKVTSFLFNGLFSGFTRHQQFGGSEHTTNRSYSRKAPGSNLNIDTNPQTRSKNDKGYHGGEYVDYEEVK